MSTDTQLTVNTEAEKRILVHDEEARKAGFAPATPYFAIGTRLAEVGKDNFRQSRIAFEHMPTVGDAMAELVEQVKSEKRQDFVTDASKIHALKDGRLFLAKEAEPVLFTDNGFKQFVQRLAEHNGVRNPAAYLSDIEPERRARILNEELKNAGDLGFKLRVRQPNGDLQLYASLGPDYPTVDADALAEAVVAKHITDDGRARVVYSGTRSQIDVLYHSNLAPEDVGVGEFYRAGLRITSDDDGTESVRGKSMLDRALCINLTTASSEQTSVVRRHIGKVENIMEAVKGAMDINYGQLKFFIEAFTAREKEDVRKILSKGVPKTLIVKLDTPKPVFEFMFEDKKWAVSGASPADIAEAATTAWLKEEADWSVAGLSNAVSRAAHEGNWSVPFVGETLEDRAGALILQPVDKLPIGLLPVREVKAKK